MLLSLRIALPSFVAPILVSLHASAQCAEWSEGFNLAGFDGTVRASVVFDDGSGPALYLGGDFTHAGSVAAAHVARWDGTSWHDVGGGIDGPVHAFTLWDDGNGPVLIAGGNFTQAGGASIESVARWDGSSWTSLDAQVHGTVAAFATYDDGTGAALFVGGSFSVNGGPGVRLAKWTGSAWTIPPVNMSGGMVRALCVYDEGAGPVLFIGGTFAFGGGTSLKGYLARWNGTQLAGMNPSFMSGSQGVFALAVHDDGNGAKLFVGGQLKLSGPGTPQFELATWDGAGFEILAGTQFSSSAVDSLLVHDDGSGAQLYVGGAFTSLGGFPASRIARWDGSSFVQVGAGLDADVLTLAAFDDGSGARVFAGGSFVLSGQVASPGCARFDGVDWQATTSGEGISGKVEALAKFDDGSGLALYAAGLFHAAGGAHAENIARWDGAHWSPVGAGLPGSEISALAVYNAGQGASLYAIGSTTLMRWDGTNWIPTGPSLQGAGGRLLATYDDGSGSQLYVIGAGLAASDGIARWNGTTMSSVPGLQIGIDPFNESTSVAVYDSGSGPKLYIGRTDKIIEYSGAGVTNMVGGSYVLALATYGSALYAGGGFASIGQPNGLARFDGTQWTGVGGGVNGEVTSLARFDIGLGNGAALYVGGTFTDVGGLPVHNFARWDGASWSALGDGIESALTLIDIGVIETFPAADHSGPDLFVGGVFNVADGKAARSIARLGGCDGPGSLFCAADGSLATACPCGQAGSEGHGCGNSQNDSGALLTVSGTTQPDELVLTSSGELANTLSIFLQGNASIANGVVFGDGVRCVGGSLNRIGTKFAVEGSVSYPEPGDLSISARSAMLGDPIAPGSTRYYQTYYRDPNLSFCALTLGKGFNVSSGQAIVW